MGFYHCHANDKFYYLCTGICSFYYLRCIFNLLYYACYPQVPNKRPTPSLLTLRFFSTPPDFIRTPCLVILRKLSVFTTLYVISLLVLFTPNFHGKIGYCDMYFSIMLYYNSLLFFLSLYNHLKPFFILQHPTLF